MPITYWTMLIGAIASAGMPPFAGLLLQGRDHRGGAPRRRPRARGFAYLLRARRRVRAAAYTFRLVFMAFHGEERFDAAHGSAPHESPAVVTVPLVLLAIPSIGAGWLIGRVVFGDYFGERSRSGARGARWRDSTACSSYTLHGLTALPFWLALAGIATAWYLYIVRTDLPKKIAMAFGPLYALVERKYGFDELYSWLFAQGARAVGAGLWKGGDQRVIDGVMVNGSARLVGWFSGRGAPGAERADLPVRVHHDLRRLRDLRGRQVPAVRVRSPS